MWPLCRSTFLHLQLSNSCPTSIRSKVFPAPGGNNAFNPTLNWCKIFKKSEMLEVCWCFFFLHDGDCITASMLQNAIKSKDWHYRVDFMFIYFGLSPELSKWANLGYAWSGVGCFVAISWTAMYFVGMGWDRKEKLSAQNLQLDAYFVENRFTGQSPP